MAKGSMSSKVGAWAFVIGGLVALILGAIPSTAYAGWVVGLLLILGIIVGLLNISDKELVAFMIACVAFLVSAQGFSAALAQGGLSTFGWLTRILGHIAIFVVPAALITAIKALFALAATR